MYISALSLLETAEGTWNAIQSALHCVHSPLGFWLKKYVFVFPCIFYMNWYLVFSLWIGLYYEYNFIRKLIFPCSFFLFNQLKILHFLATGKSYLRAMDLLNRNYINWEWRVVSYMRNDWDEALNKNRSSPNCFCLRLASITCSQWVFLKLI